MRIRLLSLFLICAAGILGFAGCGPEASGEPGQVEARDVQLLREAGGTPYITGKLVNLTDTAIPSVQVQVYFYDADNTRVEEMVFPVRDLAPGAEVAFRRSVDSDADIRRASIAGILRL